MAKLTILTGGYGAARAWADVWAQSHQDGVVFEYPDGIGKARGFAVDKKQDAVWIETNLDVQLLDFSDEVAE